MSAPTNPLALIDPAVLTGLLRTIPYDVDFLYPSLAEIERITGNKWKSRTETRNHVRAGLLDLNARLPQGVKGTITERYGENIKIGRALPIDPEELIAYNKTGEIGSEMVKCAQSLRTSIDSALEWVFMRGLFGQSITLDGGATQTLGTLGATPTVATTWTNAAAATGVADLVSAHDSAKGLNRNRSSSLILMSLTQWTNLRNQDSTKELVHSTALGGKQVSDGQLQDLLITNGLPPVRLYDAQVEVLSGATVTATTVVPNDLVLFLPSAQTFPNGYGRIIFGQSSDQIAQAIGRGDPQLNVGGYFGWMEQFSDPGRFELKANTLAGFDLECVPYSVRLDVIP